MQISFEGKEGNIKSLKSIVRLNARKVIVGIKNGIQRKNGMEERRPLGQFSHSFCSDICKDLFFQTFSCKVNFLGHKGNEGRVFS